MPLPPATDPSYGYSTFAFYPPAGSTIHPSQAIELRMNGVVDTGTITATSIQVNDDTIHVDLSAASRINLTVTNGTASGVIGIAPKQDKWFARGHQITITITIAATRSIGGGGSAPIGEYVATYYVADDGNPSVFYHPRQFELIRAYLAAGIEPWKTQAVDLDAELNESFLQPASSVYSGALATIDDVVSLYNGVYNTDLLGRRRGAWADAEYARVHALRFMLYADAVSGAAAKAMLLSWVAGFDPSSFTVYPDFRVGFYYGVLSCKWALVYDLIRSLMSAAEIRQYSEWIHKYTLVLMRVQEDISAASDSRAARSWACVGIMAAEYSRGDHRGEDFCTSGSGFGFTNPYFTVLKLIDSAIEVGPTGQPRMVDRARSGEQPYYEVTEAVSNIYALSVLGALDFLHSFRRRVWSHATPAGWTLSDVAQEYRKYVTKAYPGYAEVDGFSEDSPAAWQLRCSAAWQLMALFGRTSPERLTLDMVKPIQRGSAPADVEELLAWRGPAFLWHPGVTYRINEDPTKAVLLADYTTQWAAGHTWFRVQWSPQLLRNERDLVVWAVYLNGLEVGRTLDTTFCLTNLAPGTRYVVEIEARTAAARAKKSSPMSIKTLALT